MFGSDSVSGPTVGEWRRVAARPQTVESGVLVPLIQGAVTGALVFLVFQGLAVGMGRQDSLPWSIACGAACALLVWVFSLHQADSALWTHEYWFADRAAPVAFADVSGDESEWEELEPAVTRPTVVEVHKQVGEGVHIDRHHLGVDQRRLVELARGVLAGRTLGEREWAGSGRLFTVSEFRQLRGELLERGLIAWRSAGNPGQGVDLTEQGREVFAGLTGGSSLPAAA
jgi:hypothetical protein